MIEYLENNRLIDNSKVIGDYIINKLLNLKEESQIVGWVCGLGLHIGIEILSEIDIQQKGILEVEKIMYSCMKKGVAFKIIEQNIITLRPSLVINKNDADLLVDALKQAILEFESK